MFAPRKQDAHIVHWVGFGMQFRTVLAGPRRFRKAQSYQRCTNDPVFVERRIVLSFSRRPRLAAIAFRKKNVTP
jgi:hypothetical protein